MHSIAVKSTRPLVPRLCQQCRATALRTARLHSRNFSTTRCLSYPDQVSQFSRDVQDRKQKRQPPTQNDASDDSIPKATASTSTRTGTETHYTLFPKSLPKGPPPNGPFEIDARALRQEFLQLQAAAHPDRHSGAHKTRAEAISARINEAYRTLLDPLRRAEYLLELAGHSVSEADGIGGAVNDISKGQSGGEEKGMPGLPAGGNTEEEHALLMTVLDAREEIEEAESEADLEFVKQTNNERLVQSRKALATAFEGQDWEAARKESVRLRYWVNIRDSLQAWEKGKRVEMVH